MFTLLAAAVLAMHVSAQSDTLPGRYHFDARASDDHVAVVEEAVRNVNRLKRGRVRSELVEQLRATPTLSIHADGAGYIITDSAGRDLRVVPGAPATRVTTARGEAAEVTATMRGAALVVRVRTSRALREQVFAANAALLTVTSTYTLDALDALDAPLTLRSVYRREGR